MILLLYCFMYVYIYNDKELVFDDINNTDKFMDLSPQDQNIYMNKLKKIKNNLSNGIISDNYISDIKNSVNKFTLNKKDTDTINNISNIYMKDYIDNINKKNAIVYNEYIKFYSKSNP